MTEPSARLTCTAVDFAELGAELLRLNKRVRFQARGHSMFPLVRDQDYLLVEPVGTSRIRIGDIILCNIEAGRVLVHRVINRSTGPKEKNYLVQGDHVDYPDGWVKHNGVYGRVIAIDRNGKTLNMQKPAAKFLTILAVFRSRSRFGRGRLMSAAFGMIRHLPVFTDYLS